MSRESQRRHRARRRGEDVPLLKSGPKPGYKQSPEHVAKRIQSGEEHYAWKGSDVTVKTGRGRALRLYSDSEPCECCGAQVAERHHLDDDTRNNAPSNIAFVCRRCHMKMDGRLDALIEKRRETPARVYEGAHRYQPREKGRFV